jgi:hypothetical protein
MADINIYWKKITRGLPKEKKYAEYGKFNENIDNKIQKLMVKVDIQKLN